MAVLAGNLDPISSTPVHQAKHPGQTSTLLEPAPVHQEYSQNFLISSKNFFHTKSPPCI